MADSERVAVAAHLHVALRRKAGRVTDVDWMAVNDAYAQEIVRFAHAKAKELADPSLTELADKLAATVVQGGTRKAPPPPLVERISQSLSEPAPEVAIPNPQYEEEEASRYIGGLR